MLCELNGVKAEINEYVGKDYFVLKAAQWIQLLRPC